MKSAEEVGGLECAIRQAGGVSALADALGELRQVVQNWRTRGIPANRCKAIERLTGVSVRALRPNDWQDYWPEAPEPIPQAERAQVAATAQA